MSWWDIGEGAGYRTQGGDLDKHLVTCAFCGEDGRFSFQHRETIANKNKKTLHYDTLKCEQCGNLTMVFWGAGSGGLHDLRQLPFSKETKQWPKHWPEDIGRYWLQAKRNIEQSNWDAAALMARSALQITMRHLEAVGSNLKSEIDNLGARGLLPPPMVEWAHEVRIVGNDNAHPTPGSPGTSAADATAVVEFLSTLLHITLDLPHQISKRREK